MIRHLYLSGYRLSRMSDKIHASYHYPLGMSDQEADRRINAFARAFVNVEVKAVPL